MGKKIKNKRFRIGRFLLWFSLALFLLFAGVVGYITYNARTLINQYLPSLIYTQTDSTYLLHYDTIIIDHKRKAFVFENFELKPDTNRIAKLPFYRFQSKNVEFAGIKIKHLINGRSFIASNLKIESPITELATGNNLPILQHASKSLNKGDTLHLPFLSEVFFDTILIKNATLDFDSLLKKDNIPSIDLEIQHFKLGGQKMTDIPFPFDASDAFLKVDNLGFNLADSIHKVAVEEIRLSLLNSEIVADHIYLQPINDTLQSNDIKFDVIIPQIKASGSSLEALMQSDTIAFDEFILNKPEIKIKFGNKVAEASTPLNEINLYTLISNKMKWVKIKTLSIQNANVSLIPKNKNKAAQRFEELYVNLFDFVADSTSASDSTRILSSKNMHMKLGVFTLYHTDNIHQFVINSVFADTRSEEIHTQEIEFSPIEKTAPSTQTTININGKGLILNGVSLHRMYHEKVIPMKQLIVKQPIAEITLKNSQQSKTSNKNASLLLEKMSAYLKGVYVDQTLIQDGEINYRYHNIEKQQGFFQSRFNFDLQDLSVDSITFLKSDKIFFANDFNISFSNIKLQLADKVHRLYTDSVFISSTARTALVDNFRIRPMVDPEDFHSITTTQNTDLFDIHFPKIRLHGTNLHQAFFNKKLNIREFEISRPSFSIETASRMNDRKRVAQPITNSLYHMISDYLFSINIKTLNMTDGTLNINQHRTNQTNIELTNKFSIRMNNFLLDSKSSKRDSKLFFSDDIDLRIKDHSFNLADGIHKIKAGEIGILSSQNRFFIRDAKLYPDILSENFKEAPLTVFATIPEMQATGADIVGLFTMGKFSIEKLRFIEPDIKLLFQPDLKKLKNNEEKKPILLPQGLNSVGIGEIEIKEGKLNLSNYENHESKSFATSEINFSVDDVLISSPNNKMDTKHGNFILNMQKTRFRLNDNIHELTAQKISYHLNQPDLVIENLKLQPVRQQNLSDKLLFYNLEIPFLKLENLSYQSLKDNRIVRGKQLHLISPTINIEDKRIEKGATLDPYRLNIYPKIKEKITAVGLDLVSVSNAQINLSGDKKVKLKNLDLTLHSFLINKETNAFDNLLYASRAEAKLSDLTGKTKNGFYNYSIDAITMNHKGHIKVNNISFEPAFSKKIFFQKKRFQDDYFNLSLQNAEGWDFDLKQYFINNEINLSKVNLTFDEVSIYRDKRLPINPQKHTKLPQQLLRELNYKIKIDTTSIACNQLTYNEQEPQSKVASEIFFTNINSSVFNINNRKETLQTHPNMLLHVKGDLMGHGKVDVKLNMKLQSLNNEFTCTAMADPFQLFHVNPITEPGLKLSIKEGINKKLDVYFEANEDSAMGSMKFYYNDLKVSLLQRKNGVLKEDRFTSFMANTLVKKDNPKQGKLLLPAKMTNRRDKQRSIVNYCWKTIFAGIKSTLGMKEKEEKK